MPDRVASSSNVLHRLLAIGNKEQSEYTLYELTLKRFENPIALAPITASGDGLDATKGYWLLVMPVHYALQRDDFILYPDVPLPVTKKEANAYLDRLNEHFHADEITFYHGDSGQWYLQYLPNKTAYIDVEFVNPIHVAGQLVAPFSPAGAHAKNWQQLQNEVQMLLFDCAENQAREERSMLPINSLWFYGLGKMPTTVDVASHAKESTIFSDAPFYKGLSLAGAEKVESLKNINISEIINRSDLDHIVIDLNDQENINDWLEQAYAALKKRRINELNIQLGLKDGAVVITLHPWHFFRFWRRQLPLNEYLNKQ